MGIQNFFNVRKSLVKSVKRPSKFNLSIDISMILIPIINYIDFDDDYSELISKNLEYLVNTYSKFKELLKDAEEIYIGLDNQDKVCKKSNTIHRRKRIDFKEKPFNFIEAIKSALPQFIHKIIMYDYLKGEGEIKCVKYNEWSNPSLPIIICTNDNDIYPLLLSIQNMDSRTFIIYHMQNTLITLHKLLKEFNRVIPQVENCELINDKNLKSSILKSNIDILSSSNENINTNFTTLYIPPYRRNCNNTLPINVNLLQLNRIDKYTQIRTNPYMSNLLSLMITCLFGNDYLDRLNVNFSKHQRDDVIFDFTCLTIDEYEYNNLVECLVNDPLPKSLMFNDKFIEFKNKLSHLKHLDVSLDFELFYVYFQIIIRYLANRKVSFKQSYFIPPATQSLTNEISNLYFINQVQNYDSLSVNDYNNACMWILNFYVNYIYMTHLCIGNEYIDSQQLYFPRVKTTLTNLMYLMFNSNN